MYTDDARVQVWLDDARSFVYAGRIVDVGVRSFSGKGAVRAFGSRYGCNF